MQLPIVDVGSTLVNEGWCHLNLPDGLAATAGKSKALMWAINPNRSRGRLVFQDFYYDKDGKAMVAPGLSDFTEDFKSYFRRVHTCGTYPFGVIR